MSYRADFAAPEIVFSLVQHAWLKEGVLRVQKPLRHTPWAARRFTSVCFKLLFPRVHAGTEVLEVHVRLPRFCEHTAGLLLFFDVMFDHLGEHCHLRFEVFVLR